MFIIIVDSVIVVRRPLLAAYFIHTQAHNSS